MARKKRAAPADSFAGLTWDDLSDWAGSKIVSRGRNYQRGHHVQDLAFTPDAGLLAWVMGSMRYATIVRMERKKLVSECTCPYWDTCKHAVAAVLEYLECVKQKKALPQAAEDDLHLQKLEEMGMRRPGRTKRILRATTGKKRRCRKKRWLRRT